jgi:hypothetical protein
MSDSDFEIPWCITIGFIENLKNDYFKEISQIEKESAQQKFSDDLPLPKPLPREKQEEFFAHANIKVPEEQKQVHRECWHNIMMCSMQIKMA